jgi:hypothetical protein
MASLAVEGNLPVVARRTFGLTLAARDIGADRALDTTFSGIAGSVAYVPVKSACTACIIFAII